MMMMIVYVITRLFLVEDKKIICSFTYTSLIYFLIGVGKKTNEHPPGFYYSEQTSTRFLFYDTAMTITTTTSALFSFNHRHILYNSTDKSRQLNIHPRNHQSYTIPLFVSNWTKLDTNSNYDVLSIALIIHINYHSFNI